MYLVVIYSAALNANNINPSTAYAKILIIASATYANAIRLK